MLDEEEEEKEDWEEEDDWERKGVEVDSVE